MTRLNEMPCVMLFTEQPILLFFVQDGFRRGLSFGNDNFAIESLDPLSSSSARR